MKIFLFTVLKFGLRLLYAPIKLFRARDRIVYLSRQSDSKSLDMILLEEAIKKECPDTRQIFRLRMIPDGLFAKIKYCFCVIGDMYYLATSRVAILDTYSITVSCLKHKKSLKVIQMWHALGAIKKFGWQSVGTKEGRDEKTSRAMCMHRNYDYVLAPSKETAKFYIEAFQIESDKIKICSLPRVDYILTADDGIHGRFFGENPDLGQKKIVLYLPTFREREAYIAQELKVEFAESDEYHLIVSTHPLFSKIRRDEKFSYNGNYNTYDLMKVADIIITDYSACAFEASLLMKPLYFFVPDYKQYLSERGINTDIKEEMGFATFENAEDLFRAVQNDCYDLNKLYAFKSKYVENTKANNAEILAKFVSILM